MLFSCITLSLLEQKRFNIIQTSTVGGKTDAKLSSDLFNYKLQFLSDIKYPGYWCIFQDICSCVGGSVYYCFTLFSFLVPHINPNKSFSDLVVESQDKELDELSPISELCIICWATLCPPLQKFRWLALAALRRYVSQLYNIRMQILSQLYYCKFSACCCMITTLLLKKIKKANSNVCTEYCFLIYISQKMRMQVTRQKKQRNLFHVALYKASLMVQMVKRLPAMQETRVRSLGWEDPLEKEMATHSSTLACKIPWPEKPGRLQSMGSQTVGPD